MASLAEQATYLQQERAKLEEQKKNLFTAREQLKAQGQEVETFAGQLQSQMYPGQNVKRPAYLPRQSRELQRQYFVSGQEAITKGRADISAHEVGTLTPYEKELQTAESQLSGYESQVKKALKQEQDYEKGRKAAARGIVYPGMSKIEKQGYRDYKANAKVQEKYDKQILDLKNAGFKPVIVNGKITGFEDVVAGISIPYENFNNYLNEISKIQYRKVPAFTSREPVTPYQGQPAIFFEPGKTFTVAIPGRNISALLVNEKIPTTTAWENVLTGEKISSATFPGVLYKPIVIETFTGKVLSTPQFPQYAFSNIPNINILGIQGSIQNPNLQFDPRTGKPYGEVMPAPANVYERWKQATQQEKIKGSVYFLTEEAKRLYDINIQKQIKQGITIHEQIDPTATIMDYLVPIGLYSTPYLGASLFVGGGIEEISTKGGREVIKQRAESLQEKYGMSSSISNLISYALPIAEIGVGTLGIRSQIKTSLATRELKTFENTPLTVIGQRIGNDGSGIDFLKGYKRVGDTKYKIRLIQPFKNVGGIKVVMEGGQGFAYKVYKNGKIEAILFESGGRAYNLGVVPKLSITKLEEPYLFRKPTTTTRLLEDYQAGAGRVYIKTLAEGKYKIKNGIVFPTGEMKVSVTGKYAKVNQPSEWESYIGYSKAGENDWISYLSGKPIKMRIYKTGERSLLAKRDVFGLLRTNMPSLVYDVSKAESPLSQITQQLTSSAPTGQALKAGVSKLAPKIPSVTKATSIFSVAEVTFKSSALDTINNLLVSTTQPKPSVVSKTKPVTGLGESRFPSLGENIFESLTRQGKFGGMGVFEGRVSSGIVKETQDVSSIMTNLLVSGLSLTQLEKQQERLRQLQNLKFEEATREEQRARQLQNLKEMQKLKLKQEQKQQPSLRQSSLSISPFSPTRGFPLLFGVPKIPRMRKESIKGKRGNYKTYYILKGKKKYLPGIAPRNIAIKKGADFVRRNLRATFGIESTETSYNLLDINFQVPTDVFREYKFVKGKKEWLDDMWIQKSGTKKEGVTAKGARLASRGERVEIQMYAKMRQQNDKQLNSIMNNLTSSNLRSQPRKVSKE